MKTIIFGIVLMFSTATFSVAPTYSELQGFVNDETSVAIDLLNRTLTKLNITSCSQINSSRSDDETTIQASYTEAGLWDEFREHGPESSANCTSVAEGGTDVCDGTWDGVVENFSIRFSYKDPSEVSLALGLEKRVKIYAQTDYLDNAVVSNDVAMIIEFSCDMKKGHYFQTGSDNGATADMMEVFWNNTSTPEVSFKYAGPVRNTAVAYSRDSSSGKLSTTVLFTNIFASLNELLTEFGINDYTINPDDGSIH